MTEDDEILHEFVVEANENVEALEREVMRSPVAIDAVFRTVHTIKGTAGFFNFSHIEALTHAAESLLGQIRDGNVGFTRETADTLLLVGDACRAMLKHVAATKTDGDDDHGSLRARLRELEHAAPGAPAAPPAPAADVADTTIRVDVELLDTLMDLAGELVLARNQLVQLARDAAVAETAQRIDRITSQLREGVMRTRMQPVSVMWAKLPRIVRDLAAELGKQVELEVAGADTALDRSVIEAVRDPLTHLIRNAIDHGIEPPAARTTAGKRPAGTLQLTARHEGGHVVIELADDGRGIDPARIRAKAQEKGIDRAAKMSEPELLQLIFTPGFSTADAVTRISGRGVGMDVVKHNLAAIGGAVELQTWPNAGTRVRLTIPLTLAIMPALLVTAGGERYAVPQSGVHELVRVAETMVERVDGAPLYRLRGELLPLIHLAEVLGDARTGETIVVIELDGRRFGIVVDSVLDTEEIVIKPLNERLRALGTYSGATILGDGRVALILDLRGIAARAGLTMNAAAQATIAPLATPERQALLVARIAGERQIALALGAVTRLEQMPLATIERAGAREVVQYGNRVLPLVRLSTGDLDPLPVIVCGDVGVVVDEVIDVVEQDVVVDRALAGAGVLGATVVGGRVTELVDLAALAREVRA